VQKWGNWILPVVGVLALLLFTPIGGIINFIFIGAAMLGALALAGWAALDLLSFRDYNYLPHWKGIGLKIAGVVGLLLFAITLKAVLPSPPASLLTNHDDYCVETRSNPC
jgi:hypothetical protein